MSARNIEGNVGYLLWGTFCAKKMDFSPEIWSPSQDKAPEIVEISTGLYTWGDLVEIKNRPSGSSVSNPYTPSLVLPLLGDLFLLPPFLSLLCVALRLDLWAGNGGHGFTGRWGVEGVSADPPPPGPSFTTPWGRGLQPPGWKKAQI